MASVTSLGLHQPTALEYAVKEQLLPEDPPASLYEWEISLDQDIETGGEDELLVTKDSVIWSRGCIFRKAFGFKLEKEPITQALLAYFPKEEQKPAPAPRSSTPLPDPTPPAAPIKAPATDSNGRSHRPLAKALVVFLKTQAHIYFLDGTSHVVLIPFEVESACAAPQGVIIQRKNTKANSLAASVKFPKVPPNSFITSRPSQSPVPASQVSFNTDNMGKPKTLSLRLRSNSESVWEAPVDKNDSHWPRLVTLSDPLLELGLVVTQPEKPAKRKARRSQDKSPHFLDRAEELVHIEELPWPSSAVSKRGSALTLAVTINRETSMYTVWKLSHLPKQDPMGNQKAVRRLSDRRRSSMQPGIPSGATTPVPPSLQESFGAPMPGKRTRKSERIEKADKGFENLESTLGLDEKKVQRRSSRRVSSMLARADLSASHDRAGLTEQPTGTSHIHSRRDTSHGTQRNRSSGVHFHGKRHHTGGSIGSFLEASTDHLLDELGAGSDFDGLHGEEQNLANLAQEVFLSKIHSVPIDNSNVRYSLSKHPARTQCKVFCLTGPQTKTGTACRWQVLVGIQDPMEKRLQLLTLHLQSKPAAGIGLEPDPIDVTFGQLTKGQNVIDSCKIVDRKVSMILVLSQSGDGQRELSIQAPWSQLSPVNLPPKLSLVNLRSLDYGGSMINREIGSGRAITPVIGEFGGIRHPKLRGVVDILDEDNNNLHQIRIKLQPDSPQVTRILETLGSILPSSSLEMFLGCWWDILAWLKRESADVADIEWSAVVVLLFSLYLALGTDPDPSTLGSAAPKRRSRGFLRSSSGAQVDLSGWDAMNVYETPHASTHPIWMENKAWQWMLEESDPSQTMFNPSPGSSNLDFLSAHVKLALRYVGAGEGQNACGHQGHLPTTPCTDDEAGQARYAQDIFVALHLLLEEDKLNIAVAQTASPGTVHLRAVLLRIAQWMGWEQWITLYQLEMPSDWPEKPSEPERFTMRLSVSSPYHWSVYEWIQANLTLHSEPLRSIPEVGANMPTLLVRTQLFKKLFNALASRKLSPVDFVEAMHQSEITPLLLQSLPEAVLIPLQDAISQCQPSPPSSWSGDLLSLVDRGDIGSILSAGHRAEANSTILKTQHLASWDFSSLCHNIMEFNEGPADDVAESDKQAVIRAIFKEDRRLDETKMMLNTSKPRAVRLDHSSEWSEPTYLEKQKELVTRLATNTLSIPSGRGLMNYGLRFPLLTQKFHINGFVLNCTVKPLNTTVGVDKSLFTEEKIAWAFFHSGVAGGLSISRQAKGIDTSWILYNKPGNDLNNRHAGFLLALGLNGHLKGVAKWLAFKYLTPKHAMTSIGLLLGLAASYIGTMDSLITRLLSVHVTRMLPRGAAELNLSPLTQTTGIMGIGLLYCNSQHRRMSEIMMSEIDHIEVDDEEEPLRSECYRLAAGFALGLVNLGKGTDLKGLHDMRITEKLLTLASATKKVEQVHVLDRSSAAAVMAITLIYMKSEDHIVARKIDVPEAALQFDYIRPDILLLRTVSKHLILWSKIVPSHDWIRKNLPRRYQSRVQPPSQPFDHPSRGALDTTHLPFLSILAGLCFAIALRYAGSGDQRVRDLLLTYLHRFYAHCRFPRSKASFEEKSVQVIARMCLDVVAISCSIVMAGSCDLKVLRILRSLHSRNDPDTTYGSHMATHMAIGVLSLGCGTQTFSTSNLAIASLLIAFYPVFPDCVQDNKSHLQAFRHFWVLATDPRCLVTKDVATDAPVSVPVAIRSRASKDNEQEMRITPCLLPPLDDVLSIRTVSPEFWNLELDFQKHPEYAQAFKLTQSLSIRRRPASDSPFSATMLALGRQEAGASASLDEEQPLRWLFDAVPSLRRLTHAERSIVLDLGVGGPDVSNGAASVVDTRLALEEGVRNGKFDDLVALRGLFEWVEWRARRVQEEKVARAKGKEKEGPKANGGDKRIDWEGESWLRDSVIESLKGSVWLAGRE